MKSTEIPIIVIYPITSITLKNNHKHYSMMLYYDVPDIITEKAENIMSSEYFYRNMHT